MIAIRRSARDASGLTSITPYWRYRSTRLDERKDRDAIAAYRTEPEFVGDLNGDSTDAEPVDIGVANEFLDLQRGRIDLHNVRCLRRRGPSLASGKQRAVRGPIGDCRDENQPKHCPS